MTLTIKLRNKKAQKKLEGLEELKLIALVRDNVPAHWSAKKKKQATEFLAAYGETKLAEQGKIKLKTLDELIDER